MPTDAETLATVDALTRPLQPSTSSTLRYAITRPGEGVTLAYARRLTLDTLRHRAPKLASDETVAAIERAIRAETGD